MDRRSSDFLLPCLEQEVDDQFEESVDFLVADFDVFRSFHVL
jgi:hypothetical protein